jgi:hypothetical protein
MARIRSIKPTFFRSRSVKTLSDKAKLVWIGLWNVADDDGRLVDELGILTGDLWALSVSEAKLDKTLDELAAAGRIIRYKVAGQGYIQVAGWEHQKINRATPSAIPPVSLRDDSLNAHGALTGGREGKGRDKEGEAFADANANPPAFCPSHPGGTVIDCRACGDARRAHDVWVRAQKNKPTPLPPRTDAVDAHEHRWQPDGTCRWPGCIERESDLGAIA